MRVARKTDQLSAKGIASKKRPGYYADGGGLYLQVSRSGSKSWIFRYMLNSKEREMGLGSLLDVSLADARQKRDDYRKLARAGVDPIDARKRGEQDQALALARGTTFKECAESFIRANRARWTNDKHASQWETTLAAYVYPVFGALPVQAIDTALVVKALMPIWTTKAETATRVRARIEAVLSSATALDYRAGENPARWRGHLDKLLPKLEKRRRVKHHPALSFEDLGGFIQELRLEEGLPARALEILILNVTRAGETAGARWPEFDLDAAIWTIPAARMKSHRAHRIPLTARSVRLLRELREWALSDEFVFPGKSGQPLSTAALLALLKRMGRDLTVHGFRSTFRDWASERTSYSRDVCEMALAHVVGDQTEAAYRRGDLFEKRRRLMAEWAKFCETTKRGDVVPLRRAKA